MQDILVVSEAVAFEAELDASQVVSNPNSSTARATATFTFFPELNQLGYDIDFSGLNLEPTPGNRTSTQDINKIHIHSGSPSQVGPHVLNIFGLPSEDDSNLVVDFENERLSGIWDNSDAINPDTGLFFDQSLGGSTKFLSDFVDELQSGNLYVAVHTAGLEGQVAIRGQIQPVEVSTINPSSPISFTDIAVNDGAGITYRRTPSPQDEAYQQLQQEQPTINIQDAANLLPFKSRGAPGVAIFDYDGDGDEDLYVTNGPGSANSLYQNQLSETGQVSFIDVAASAGVAAIAQDSSGVSYGDIDNDGDLDLLVLGLAAQNQLFENQGDGTFLDITEQSQIGGGNAYSVSSSLGDVNGDGLLDIVIGNSYTDWSNMVPIFSEPFARNEPNQLLINKGNNVFEDVSDASGLTNISSLPPGVSTITWAIAMVDYDLDGDIDIIHADDQAAISDASRGGIDRGYIQVFDNDGTGQFTNVTEAVKLNRSGSWMGLAFGDFDADGNLDVFATNFSDYTNSAIDGFPVDRLDSRWFLGQDDGTFTDPGVGTLGSTPFGWGSSAFDYDNDSDTDLIFHGGIDQGILIDASNPGAILKNDGAANFSYDLNAIRTSTNHLRRNVHGVAVADLNQDGFRDVVSVANLDIPESVPITTLPFPLGSALDGIAGVVSTLVPTENPGEFAWTGFEFTDGTLSVELNSASNGNHWVAVEAQGTVDLIEASQTNRSGIGATVFFTPDQGNTAINPILGGSSYASQDSLIANFGLGNAEAGTVEMLWTGGVRNRLYDVQAGEKVFFPEIPVSFTGEFDGVYDYQSQMGEAIADLVTASVLNREDGERFFKSGIRAFMDENALANPLLFGGPTDDQDLVGTATDEHLYGRGGNDIIAGGLGDDTLFGGHGDDLLRGDLNRQDSQGEIGGNDVIYGGAGNDRIGGKGGNDTLLGEAGDDWLWGDDGDDILRGGLGNDTLSGDGAAGNEGRDIFVLAKGEGMDIITDFEIGIDSIGLADGLTFGQLTFVDSEIRFGDERLATLNHISVSQLSEADFVTV